MKTALAAVLALSLLALVIVAVGAWRWGRATDALLSRLERARVPTPPIVHEHEGTFNMSETGEQWRPFTSWQRVVTDRPGFLRDGRIAVAPAVRVRVPDAYVAGEGLLHASLFGLLPVARMRDSGGEVARGELMRFFAEAAWYPTALLPSRGVRWTAGDASSADATLTDGSLTLTLRFRFGEEGLVRSVRARSRGRTIGGDVVPGPWEGVWDAYEERSGMLVPTEGEVAWLPPEGRQPYWRGRVTTVEHRSLP